MNVRVRFVTVAACAALVVGAVPLVAQSTAQDVVSAPAVSGLMSPSALTAVADRAPLVGAAGATLTESVPSANARGPAAASARVASHATASTNRNAPPVIQNRTSNRNALAFMIVGGAALVIGAVIGDDAGTIVMLGGAAIGLYGLYQFLT